MAFDSNKQIRTYLPVNLDLSGHPAKWQDYEKWVIGCLYLKRHTERERIPGDFYPLSSAILTKTLPKRDYREILDLLIEDGIIEAQAGYRVSTATRKGQSRGYRLASPYQDTQYRESYLTDARLVRKVQKRKESEEKAIRADVHLHLRGMLHRLEVVDGFPADNLGLDRIRNGDFNFSICGQGRVHTNLTNLNREGRKFLRFEGKPLHCIDIVNCQPLLLGLSLTNPTIDAKLKEYRRNILPIPSIHHPIQSLSPYVGTLSEFNTKEDVSRYIQLCLDGAIYERLVELTGYSREQVKGYWCATIYGQPNIAIKSRTGKAFACEWPNVWLPIRKMNNGEALARKMQMLESYLVIVQGCRRIIRDFPAAPLWTLHDSIVTTDENLERFAALLKDEVGRATGTVPAIKISTS